MYDALYAVPPVLEWSITNIIVMNENTNGSCMASGNPRPLAEVIISSHCDYSSKSITISHFTTRVEFSIARVTEDCEYVYCYTPGYQAPNFRRRLNITGKANLHSYIIHK